MMMFVTTPHLCIAFSADPAAKVGRESELRGQLTFDDKDSTRFVLLELTTRLTEESKLGFRSS